MKDMISLGPVPIGEKCTSIEDDNYRKAAFAECERYINLIKKRFTTVLLLEKAKLAIHLNRTDQGIHYEVVIIFDDEDDEAIESAQYISENLPHTWEDTTLIE